MIDTKNPLFKSFMAIFVGTSMVVAATYMISIPSQQWLGKTFLVLGLALELYGLIGVIKYFFKNN